MNTEKKSLVELALEHKQFIEQLTEGDIPNEQFLDDFNNNQDSLEEKLKGYQYMIELTDSQVSSIDLEVKRLQARKKNRINLKSKLNWVLANVIKNVGTPNKKGNPELEFDLFKVVIQPSYRMELHEYAIDVATRFMVDIVKNSFGMFDLEQCIDYYNQELPFMYIKQHNETLKLNGFIQVNDEQFNDMFKDSDIANDEEQLKQARQHHQMYKLTPEIVEGLTFTCTYNGNVKQLFKDLEDGLTGQQILFNKSVYATTYSKSTLKDLYEKGVHVPGSSLVKVDNVKFK